MIQDKENRKMIKQIKMGVIALAGIMMLGLIPGAVHAEKAHSPVSCNECHKSGFNPRSMTNICTNCHVKSGSTSAQFSAGDGSNAMAHNSPGISPGDETSHNWAGFSTTQAPAGAANPMTTFYYSRYSISKNRTTCTICHDPHGDTGTKLVRATLTSDLICQQCHGSWFVVNDSNDANPVNDTNALQTHPIVIDYAAFAATKPNDYNATVNNAGSGGVRLVNGSVSCTSCHGTHYTDSTSATADGKTTYNNDTMAIGDGHLLRSDGPLRTGVTRNGATGTAQLRSNLCQACHKIELHGQGATGDHMIGCLDCHGGHSYNGGTSNAYILNKQTPDAVPTRPNSVNGPSVQITFSSYPNGGLTRTKWADETLGGSAGFCEKCHGDANSAAMVVKAGEHEVGNTNECTTCHKHNDPADLFSFNRDASAATCGQCHGFPPYLNQPGDRTTGGVDGGYGVNEAAGDPNTPYDYVSSTTYEKDETQTGHKVHAGADLPTSPAGAADWYFVGISGIDNCKVCHGPSAGAAAGGHREAPLTRPNTFRDVPFDAIAKTGGMSPVYNINSPWTCSNVYCHTNGAPYTGASRPARNYSVVNVTPPWVGTGTNYAAGGFGSIYSQATRCSSCHGNTTATMTSKSNSAAHQAHLGAATTLNMAKVFDCKTCHVKSAGSPTTLAAGAMDGRSGGEHVNGLIDVDFETGATPNTLPNELIGSIFTATTGECSTYCHNVTGDAGAMAADWDVTTDMQCDSCHGGLGTDISGNGGYGAIATGSHVRHVTDVNGPKLACSKCHNTNADTGKQTGHFDGSTTNANSLGVGVCTTCHAVDAGETVPVWGVPGTRDCLTCHTGLTTTAVGQIGSTAAPAKANALTTGHTRPTASGAYTSGNNAANQQCTVCHDTATIAHFDATKGDKLLTASGTDCLVCHGAAGTAVNKDIKAHMGKACVACHDPHGSSNIEMVHSSSATQNAKDLSATGKFAANVVFTQRTGADSFDEVGYAAGANNDDLCATCHTLAAGTNHNNRDGAGSHSDGTHEGEDCLTCHAAHNASGGNAFIAAGGTACNQCHGNPPATGAHRNGTLITDAELHSITGSNTTAEPRADCARCHTGADLYTYDPGADQLAGRNHSNKTGRRTLLATSVGYQKDVSNKWFCASACHNASAADGFWYTWDGTTESTLAANRTPVDTSLNCNACHYQNASPTSAGNTAAGTRALSSTHGKHFDKLKVCASCHVVPVDTSHITTAGADDLTKISGRAQALQNEATVDFASQTTKYTIDAGNTCTSTANNGLGCHATGAPTWGTAGPLACVACHTNKTTSAVNPTSGLHSVTPLVSGKQHDESFTYNAGANTADCSTCHTASPTVTATDHQNGTLDATRGAAGNTKINFAATVSYTDGVAPTCAPSLTGCHYEQPTKTLDWRRKWHEGAANATGACAGCHGDWVNTWNTNVTHHTNAKAQSTHGTKAGKTYECLDCHSLEAVAAVYPFTIGSNDWRQNAGENTTLHGNGVINVNTTGTAFSRVGGISGCPTCHTNWQTDGKHAYTVTEWALATIAGDAPTVTCATCHGGLTAGANAANYWPDKPGNDGTEDNAGRHLLHMTRLAKAKYNEDITTLLTNNANGTSDAKQKYLCAYCHTSPGSDDDHSNVLPAEVFLSNVASVSTRSSKTLWDTADSDATYTSGNCSNVECHNGKATATTATFDWYGAGTGNCAVCHNDITVTTAGTTGATHQAHLNAPTFGKVMTCGNCHGGTPAWSPYTVPSVNHINGTFKVEGGSVIDGTVKTYTGTYTNAATRTPGSCGTNSCHNNGKNAATAAYTWQTAIAGCAACHATSSTLGSSHDPHMNAGFATTFGRAAVGCNECHDAVSASDMTAKTAHIDGSVNLKAGITYTGNLSVATAASYGACSASDCHQTGKGANVTSPVWNRTASSTDNCTICHNNGASQANPNTGRHNKHVANTAYVTLSCGSCHANATATTIGGTTHINATANTGVNITAHTAGAADCTNNCHVVTAATSGDWLDAAVLACTECHTSGKIAATAGALPVSGLHAVTPRISAMKHDQTLNVANGCEFCHTTIRAATTTHIKGNFVVDGAGNNDRGLFAAYADAATGSCSGTGVNSAAGCHRDNGKWGRKWTTTVTANDGSECVNCHGGIGVGYTATTWTSGVSPSHTADWNADSTANEITPNHSICKTCHGFAGASSKDDNYVLTNAWNQGGADTSMHGNSKITMNGGTQYNETNFGCDAAGCHGDASTLHRLADSGWTTELGSFAAGGSCFGCHGNGSTQYWPDDLTNTTYPDRAGHHEEHVIAIAEKMAGGDTLANRNASCIYCHSGTPGEPGHGDNVPPANVVNTDTDNNGIADTDTAYKFKRLISPYGSDSTGFWRSTPGTCSNIGCHASAPFTPHWYSDTVAPGSISNLAVAGNAEPGTLKLTWSAPGNDGALDGTPYRYDVRYSTSSITEGNFASATQAAAPTAYRKGGTQTQILRGLPAGTLYFAVKTYDEAGNASLISNVASGTAQTDNVAPIFSGISAVSTGDESFNQTPNPDTNSVYLSWSAARDHSHSLTTPINYLVMWSTASLRTHFSSNGAMPATIGTDACFSKLAPQTQVTCGSVVPASNEYRIKSAISTALNYNVTDLPVGTIYTFLVRAKDQAGNVDTNRNELMAMAKSTTMATRTLVTAYTSAAVSGTATTGADTFTGTLGAAYPGTAPSNLSLTQNDVITWSPATNFTEKKTIYGLSFQLKLYNPNSAVTMSYQLGYLNGSTFTAIKNKAGADIAAKTYSLGRRATRVIKFPLGDYVGTIPSGCKPAFRLTITGATSTALTGYYGSVANKGGQLLYNLQSYNDLPSGLGTLSQSQVASSFIGGNLYRLTWSAANPTPNTVDEAQTVHYDVFGSIDNGSTWPYVIGRNLATNTVDWDPVGDGITGNQTAVKFKVMAGDGFRSGDLYSKADADQVNHSEMISSTFTVNNSADIWTPAAIGSAIGTADDLVAETRPKQGSVYLTWKAVGNDGFNHGTRATQYDIRYNTVTINDANWATSTQATNEPYPDFTGAMEGYEVLGLNDDAPYFFAMKVGDQAGNWSPISNVASINSGPKCGICHSTPPDESATAGNHIKHGYTKSDCGNCHGSAAATYGVDHQDGILKVGFKTATPYAGIISANRLYYTTDGTSGGTVIYDDTTGGGGFVDNGTDHLDNGTCSGFNAANANGCHGPASPSWNAAATLACSACHGNAARTTDTYGRKFDATIDNGDVVPDEVKAAPPNDNHGLASGKYVGAHLKHLNSSFRLAKGDNCELCHANNEHADGTVDIAYDLDVTGAGALWTPNATGAGTPGTCAGTATATCHGSNTPSWDSAATVACVSCHGFNGTTPSHVTDPQGGVSTAGTGNCTMCHPAGHPQGTVQEPLALMVPNNPVVGIAYKSGGIHLLKTINSRSATTEAQICWGCHNAQTTKITEWGSNNDVNTGSSPYNYGAIFTDVGFATPTTNWTSAYWQSGTTAFQTYKKGKIQSTHTTNPAGTSAVTYDSTNKRYNETVDAVGDIRCSNCHDVHNLNKAENDNMTGTPYLRGSWMGNPYNEDGAPQLSTNYLNVPIGSYGFGYVPRGGTGYRQLGGYFIDQNNVVPGTASSTANAAIDDYPTAGWTLENSAGLCVLCHSNDVDNMDQTTGESLWMGTNGHSNSAIGGTFTNAANIFSNKTGGLTGLPTAVYTTSKVVGTQVPDMAYQIQVNNPSTTRGYGYRGTTGGSNAGGYKPVTATLYAMAAYDWGATVDADTVDQMFHQFSCSKCHNPHASRLPKLLITNCLDVQHNTWQTGQVRDQKNADALVATSAQTAYTAAALTDVDAGWKPAYYASAQNCHRYNNLRTAANKGGWNKVSTWTNPNQ